jgi:AraC-like DNA-binding protein
MKNKVLNIKNMVCPRCISVVKSIADAQEIGSLDVQLGEIILKQNLADTALKSFEMELNKNGFELIDSRNKQLVDKIKKCILTYVFELHNEKRGNLSESITSKMDYDYSYLSNLFSSIEGITIEQFFILQRIEKAKELLSYDQLSISEIAFQLGFSSVHHLSSQFKKTTGITPSDFKITGVVDRKTLDF